MGKSREFILVVVGMLSLVIPASLCAALLILGKHSILQLAATTLAIGSWLALVALVNWWGFTSAHLRLGWVAAFTVTAVVNARGATGLPVISPITVQDAAVVLLWAPAAWAILGVVRARRPGAPAIDLGFPLAGGTYLVADGGDGARSFLVNYHYGFGRHRVSGASASMRYAMDVVAIGASGAESRGFLPTKNEAYRIWRREVVAPCGGIVVHAADGVPDNSAFGPNRPYGVGNHVVLRCGEDVYVLLGHLANGSVRVEAGQQVCTGEAIGRVGNSGWTERPHLHMQATRSATGDWWHGEPVPCSFGGRFLVKNQTFRTA